ncbi:10181_t:CDS:10 [Funneliformis mosseae]|uniref:10181_t:CDS:1 n=1 Tax=Funneliformis mosseae TaxID=27381 RepID=A0A9N9ACD1_FUNMO|nr:10181_t:CDS:10 [Funneliformis mosseae]
MSLSGSIKSKLYISHSSITLPKSCHENIILDHPYNNHLEIFFPSIINFPEQIPNSLDSEFFYYKVDLPLSWFIDTNFIQNYVKAGRVVALSLTEGIDIANVIALDFSGNLILNLTKDTYEELGLDGHSTKFGPNKQRFVVQIDLKRRSLIPGKKGYERIKWCFNNTLTKKFTFLMSFVKSTEKKTCEIDFPSSFNAKKLLGKFDFNPIHKGILIPDLSIIKNISNESQWRLDAVEIYDWIGMNSIQAQRIQSHDQVDPYISVYKPPEPYSDGNGSFIKWSGFIPSSTIKELFDSVFKDDKISWAIINVWGFKDSPISWNKQEHGYFMNGENNYSFIIYNDGTYVLYQALALNEPYLEQLLSWLLMTVESKLSTHEITFTANVENSQESQVQPIQTFPISQGQESATRTQNEFFPLNIVKSKIRKRDGAIVTGENEKNQDKGTINDKRQKVSTIIAGNYKMIADTNGNGRNNRELEKILALVEFHQLKIIAVTTNHIQTLSKHGSELFIQTVINNEDGANENEILEKTFSGHFTDPEILKINDNTIDSHIQQRCHSISYTRWRVFGDYSTKVNDASMKAFNAHPEYYCIYQDDSDILVEVYMGSKKFAEVYSKFWKTALYEAFWMTYE